MTRSTEGKNSLPWAREVNVAREIMSSKMTWSELNKMQQRTLLEHLALFTDQENGSNNLALRGFAQEVEWWIIHSIIEELKLSGRLEASANKRGIEPDELEQEAYRVFIDKNLLACYDFHRDTTLRDYIASSLSHLAIALWRAKNTKRRKASSLDAMPDIDFLFDQTVLPEEEILAREQAAVIKELLPKAIALLTPTLRQALELRLSHETLTGEQLGELVGISAGTMKKNLSRGYRELAQIILLKPEFLGLRSILGVSHVSDQRIQDA